MLLRLRLKAGRGGGKLQAKATYEQAVRNLTENRLALGMAALKEAP